MSSLTKHFSIAGLVVNAVGLVIVQSSMKSGDNFLNNSGSLCLALGFICLLIAGMDMLWSALDDGE